jgi:hypothetical protein
MLSHCFSHTLRSNVYAVALLPLVCMGVRFMLRIVSHCPKGSTVYAVTLLLSYTEE